MCDEYKKAGIIVFLALVKGNVQKLLVRSKFYEKYEKNNVFLTVHDAVIGALRRHPALLTSIILDSPFYPITNTRGSDSRPGGAAFSYTLLALNWHIGFYLKPGS